MARMSAAVVIGIFLIGITLVLSGQGLTKETEDTITPVAPEQQAVQESGSGLSGQEGLLIVESVWVAPGVLHIRTKKSGPITDRNFDGIVDEDDALHYLEIMN